MAAMHVRASVLLNASLRPPFSTPGHLAVVKYLLSQGAGVEQRSVMQETALMCGGLFCLCTQSM
jgi:hypothetical protein